MARCEYVQIAKIDLIEMYMKLKDFHEENENLKRQIEKMKYCENCNNKASCNRASRVRCRVYKTCDKWELKKD